MAGSDAMKAAPAGGAQRERGAHGHVLVCIVVLVAWALFGSSVRADAITPRSMLPRIRMPGAPIPANGAIVLESLDSIAPLIEVTSSEGVFVPGAAHEVGALRFGGLIFAWVPDEPFQPGTYTVTKRHPYDSSLFAPEDIEVIEPASAEPPLMNSVPSASEVSTRSESYCCMDPISEDRRPCTVVEQSSVIHVEGGLSSAEPASKLNQYLFRYEAAHGSGLFTVTKRFMPIDQLPPVIFESEADQYCFVLKVLNVATLEEHEYPELPSCAERGTLHVGPTRFAPDPQVLDPGLCPFPPRELRSAWCISNERACEAEPGERCAQYEHVCRNGPLPQRWVQMGLPGRIVFSDQALTDQSEADALCSVRAPGRTKLGGEGGWLALVALLGLCRRARYVMLRA
jgi:hypothetical protein